MAREAHFTAGLKVGNVLNRMLQTGHVRQRHPHLELNGRHWLSLQQPVHAEGAVTGNSADSGGTHWGFEPKVWNTEEQKQKKEFANESVRDRI